MDGRRLPIRQSRLRCGLQSEAAWEGHEWSRMAGVAAYPEAGVAWPWPSSSRGAGSVVYPHSRVSSMAVYPDVERPSARPVGSEIEHGDEEKDGEGQDHDKAPEVQFSFYPARPRKPRLSGRLRGRRLDLRALQRFPRRPQI